MRRQPFELLAEAHGTVTIGRIEPGDECEPAGADVVEACVERTDDAAVFGLPQGDDLERVALPFDLDRYGAAVVDHHDGERVVGFADRFERIDQALLIVEHRD